MAFQPFCLAISISVRMGTLPQASCCIIHSVFNAQIELTQLVSSFLANFIGMIVTQIGTRDHQRAVVDEFHQHFCRGLGIDFAVDHGQDAEFFKRALQEGQLDFQGMFPGVGLVFAEGRQLLGRLPPEIGTADLQGGSTANGLSLASSADLAEMGISPKGVS